MALKNIRIDDGAILCAKWTTNTWAKQKFVSIFFFVLIFHHCWRLKSEKLSKVYDNDRYLIRVLWFANWPRRFLFFFAQRTRFHPPDDEVCFLLQLIQRLKVIGNDVVRALFHEFVVYLWIETASTDGINFNSPFHICCRHAVGRMPK